MHLSIMQPYGPDVAGEGVSPSLIIFDANRVVTPSCRPHCPAFRDRHTVKTSMKSPCIKARHIRLNDPHGCLSFAFCRLRVEARHRRPLQPTSCDLSLDQYISTAALRTRPADFTKNGAKSQGGRLFATIAPFRANQTDISPPTLLFVSHPN